MPTVVEIFGLNFASQVTVSAEKRLISSEERIDYHERAPPGRGLVCILISGS